MVISLYAVPTLLCEVHTLLHMMVVASIICGTFCIMYDGYILLYAVLILLYAVLIPLYVVLFLLFGGSGSFVIM